MAIPVEPIKRKRGDTKDLKLTLTQDGVIYPLTGCTALLSVNSKKEPTTNDYLFQSIAAIDIPTGVLTFPFTDEDVNHVGDFYYDVQITDGSGKKSTILEGKWTLKQDITKD